MADEETLGDGKAAWTIKSVSVETRKLAVACAGKQDMTMAEWLDRAVRTQANLEAGDRIFPPSTPPAGALTTPPRPATSIGVGELAGLMQAAQGLAQAAGVPVAKATAGHAMALLRDQLRAARGLPALPPRQTRPKNGQTIEGKIAGLPGLPGKQTEAKSGQTTEQAAAAPEPLVMTRT